MKIYHNPRCKKSRETLDLLQDRGYDPEVIYYLQEPPLQQELKTILGKLNLKPSQVTRVRDSFFKDNYKNQHLTEKDYLDLLIEHPKLLERPIVVTGEAAAIGRPIENVTAILK